jgi:two-component sensor histidine kinase
MAFNSAAGAVRRLTDVRSVEEEAGSPAAGLVHEEVNHRLANSLQLISALISLEARGVSDPTAREVLEATRRRIVAVGEVHRRLYQSGAEGSVDLAEYLAELAMRLEQGLGGDRRIRVVGRPAVVSAQRAAAVGVIVTEVVINAWKHAYGPDESGDVHIKVCSPWPDRFALEVRDHGRGRPADDGHRVDGAGAKIVEAMARQLGAEHAYLPTPQGARFALSGPLEEYRSVTAKTYV